MSRDFYLVCQDCRCQIQLGSQGVLTPQVGGDIETNGRILDFILKHQDCGEDHGPEGVTAVDEHRMFEFGWSGWREDHGEPTKRAVAMQEHREWLAAHPEHPSDQDRLEDALRDQGMPVPSREEKAAIYAASGLPACDPNRVTEGFERAADLLEPLRDPTLEPLQRPQEPR